MMSGRDEAPAIVGPLHVLKATGSGDAPLIRAGTRIAPSTAHHRLPDDYTELRRTVAPVNQSSQRLARVTQLPLPEIKTDRQRFRITEARLSRSRGNTTREIIHWLTSMYNDPWAYYSGSNGVGSRAVSYTHLTLPTKRIV